MREDCPKIVAIGGGATDPPEPETIGREIVRLSGKKHPKALFIPTASSDDKEYWERFRTIYGDQLGCRTSVLYLLGERPSANAIREMIFGSDIIFVGGGNTLKMMRRWRFLGVDKMIEKAGRQGKVLCGTSAGAICWFDSGHSDSMAYYHPKRWDYIQVQGLGMLHGVCCPHFHGEGRVAHFEAMIGHKGGMGIALDDYCAIEVVGKRYRIISSKPGAGAYRVYRQEGRVHREPIPQTHQYQSVRSLLLI